ncbi:hypothetical protein DRF62_07025 [Chryseobacterium piscium]|uniref:Uncharacterized protein n=1 Tax=Chryseobacterium piscium TaxID=333702 RepID=A0A3D9BNT3_9FLAO|nr:hypothetical protein [Chryseobacterium piscium]REC55173.1 hypothetical protein DRF62_07025 [Chryseobacterium piscium]
MENIEELERKIIEVLKIDFERSAGANGTDYGKIDDILNMNLEDRNAFLDRMAKENKIAYLNPVNGRMITLPKRNN